MTLHSLVWPLEEGILLIDATIIHHVVAYWLMSSHFSFRNAVGIFDLCDSVELLGIIDTTLTKISKEASDPESKLSVNILSSTTIYSYLSLDAFAGLLNFILSKPKSSFCLAGTLVLDSTLSFSLASLWAFLLLYSLLHLDLVMGFSLYNFQRHERFSCQPKIPYGKLMTNLYRLRSSAISLGGISYHLLALPTSHLKLQHWV